MREVKIGAVGCLKGHSAGKEDAIKPLEEAAEVYAAWQLWQESGSDCDIAEIEAECADLIQAVCTLLGALGVHDMRDAMAECRMQNEARGRIYAPADSWEQLSRDIACYLEDDSMVLSSTADEWASRAKDLSEAM